jgi:hypothetical protein
LRFVAAVSSRGRLIRVERGSLLQLKEERNAPSQELPRWVTIKQAAADYQVGPNMIRRIIAHNTLMRAASVEPRPSASTANRWCDWADSRRGRHDGTALDHHRRSR